MNPKPQALIYTIVGQSLTTQPPTRCFHSSAKIPPPASQVSRDILYQAPRTGSRQGGGALRCSAQLLCWPLFLTPQFFFSLFFCPTVFQSVTGTKMLLDKGSAG